MLAAVVAVLALGGLAFTLLGSSTTKITDPVAEAATISSDAGGYRIHMAISVSSPSTGTSFTAVGDGTVNTRDHAARVTLAMNLGENPQVTQALGASTLRITELVDGTSVYMKLPTAVVGALGSLGKPWLKLDVAKALHMPGLASMESNPAMGAPSQMLQYLRAVSASVIAEGHQRVGGFETTRYHADLSLDRVVSALPPAEQGAAQHSIAALEQATLIHTVPVDVWIDRHHLVRRMQMSFTGAVSGGQATSLGLRVDYSDYGPQSRPTLPPPDQVQDVGAPVAGLSGH